jgi:hypothetical protein
MNVHNVWITFSTNEFLLRSSYNENGRNSLPLVTVDIKINKTWPLENDQVMNDADCKWKEWSEPENNCYYESINSEFGSLII